MYLTSVFYCQVNSMSSEKCLCKSLSFIKGVKKTILCLFLLISKPRHRQEKVLKQCNVCLKTLEIQISLTSLLLWAPDKKSKIHPTNRLGSNSSQKLFSTSYHYICLIQNPKNSRKKLYKQARFVSTETKKLLLKRILKINAFLILSIIFSRHKIQKFQKQTRLGSPETKQPPQLLYSPDTEPENPQEVLETSNIWKF